MNKWSPSLPLLVWSKSYLFGITKQGKLTTYLSFDDICQFSIKIEKQFTVRRPFQTTCSNSPERFSKYFSLYIRVDTFPMHMKNLHKHKGIVKVLTMMTAAVGILWLAALEAQVIPFLPHDCPFLKGCVILTFLQWWFQDEIKCDNMSML